MKKIHIILVVVVLIIIGVVLYKTMVSKNNVPIKNETQLNIHDGTYLIAGKKVTLKNDISVVEAAPGSASKITTRYFGNDLYTDINSDGEIDTVFFITQDTGGSGVFYYVVALVHTANGNVGSEALLLGDRIAPQNILLDQTNNKKNVIIVHYAERKAGQDFSIAPSVGKSMWIKLDTSTMQWGEVAQNFEGEADPSNMTLGMKNWEWIKTTYNDGKEVLPRAKGKFVLTFKNNKTFSATTDCNGVGGEYTTSGNTIAFDRMISTMMYCEGSQEADFAKMITQTQSYFFTAKGELVFNLKFDSGSVIFK